MINDAVIAYGQALLDADDGRVGTVNALGVDEVLFARLGRWRTQAWSTSIVDVAGGQLLDVIEGRSAGGLCAWLDSRPEAWRDAIAWAVLDLSGPWRAAFDTMLPEAVQVADPFHLVKLANQRLDEVRRRVQNDTLGHRGHKHDPLYRARRLLTRADERLDDRGRTKLLGLLDAGDPHGEVRTAWHAKETVRAVYDIADPDLAAEFVERLGWDLQDESCPPEIRILGRTIVRWADQIGDDVRRRVQQETTGHRGHKGDPLYGIRRPLLVACERLSEDRLAKIFTALDAGDPDGHVGAAWCAKELLREVWHAVDLAHARRRLTVFFQFCADAEVPELTRLARTVDRWSAEILNYHRTSRASNGKVENLHMLAEKIRRTAHGFTNYDNYRRRLLGRHGAQWHTVPTARIRGRQPRLIA